MADYLYVHVPFCKSICFYCDFTHRIYDEEYVDKWLIELEKEIDYKSINRKLRTIYIGGGTPSCLDILEIKRLLEILKPYSAFSEEYTIEINPETLTKEKALIFKEYGINRVSLGVQTFNDSLLKLMNRHHTKEDILNCIEILHSVGIYNISCDLMYSLPNQTEEMFIKDIEALVDLKIPHISFYSLTIEENTVFYIKGYKPLNEEIEANMYEAAKDFLINNEYIQYEVSNFCLNGYESIHNKAYWDYEDFYGISIGASGKENHIRYDNTKDYNKYLYSIYLEKEIMLNKEDEMFENLMMSLRLKDGLNLYTFKQRYEITVEDAFKDKLENAIKKGYVVIENNNLKCTNRAILNTVLVEFMD